MVTFGEVLGVSKATPGPIHFLYPLLTFLGGGLPTPPVGKPPPKNVKGLVNLPGKNVRGGGLPIKSKSGSTIDQLYLKQNA